MAQYNQGYNPGPDPYKGNVQTNIPGQPVHQGQPIMYQNQPGQQMMYQNQPGQQMMYRDASGRPMQGGYYPQPLPEYWMERPVVSGCPPGLEYLTQIDQLLVKQKINMFEVVSGYEMNNIYDLKNILGQTVYRAKEDTDCCKRYWCGPNRPFLMHVNDNLNHEVIRIRREYKCHMFGHCMSCASCCQDEIEVEAPPGVCVGFVRQYYEGCQVRYAIMDENRDIVMKIHGPNYFRCYCPGDDYPLSLLSANGDTEIGRISKQWTNLVQEYFFNADNFGIQFPMDLDVRMKAVILGAVFLIDFMYFERHRQRGYNY